MPDLALVKRNVSKMVDQSAPESDIDAYIASESTTVGSVRDFGQDKSQTKPDEQTLGGALASAVTDAIPEAYRTTRDQIKSAGENLGFNKELSRKQYDEEMQHPYLERLFVDTPKHVLNFGKGVVQAETAPLAPLVGVAKSVLGHPLSYAYQQADKINPNNVPGEGFTPPEGQTYYDVAKGDVSTALSAVPASKGSGLIGDAQAIRPGEAFTKPQTNARSLVNEAMQADQISPNSLATRMSNANKSGVPTVALDVAEKNIAGVPMKGRNVQGLAEAAANMPGEGGTIAAQTAARKFEQHDRISGFLDDLLGRRGYYSVADDVVKNIDEQANPAREKALAYPKNISSPIINDMLSRPAGLRAIPIAVTKAKEAGESLGKLDAAGNLKNFNTRTLHWIKMAYDDLINSQEGKNQITDKMTEVGRQWTINKNKINDVIKSQNPAYKDWMQKYGEEASRKRALDEGRNFHLDDPEKVFRKFGEKTEPDRQAYMVGVKRNLQDRILKAGDNADAVKRIWNAETRAKLKAITTPTEFRTFTKRMELERRVSATDQRNMGGSPTMPRQEYSEKIKQGSALPGVGALKSALSPKSAIIDAGFQAMAKSLQRKVAKMNADTATEVMKILYTKEPGKILKLKAVAQRNGLPVKEVIKAIAGLGLKAGSAQTSGLNFNPGALITATFGQNPATARDKQQP